MKIKRQELVNQYNPIKKSIEVFSPLSVGNGEFAFTCDITGLQTFYQLHVDNKVPLCTMSQWGWHRTPNKEGSYYTQEDLEMTEYNTFGRTVYYPVENKEGNEEVYDWLRHNPHKINLARFYFEYGGSEVLPDQITDIEQILDLYTGILQSRFLIEKASVKVETICHAEKDTLGFQIISDVLTDNKLEFNISFPYGSHDITASDWESEHAHRTIVTKLTDRDYLIERYLDSEAYFVSIHSVQPVSLTQTGHIVTVNCTQPVLELTANFTKKNKFEPIAFSEIKKSSRAGFEDFWENGAMIDLRSSKATSANELQRRIILSLYLIYIQCCGSIPSQETGLTCNSWYGKFHLEMHPLHQAFLPLWNRSRYLIKSISWYKKVLNKAKENAMKNGYKGARWPKMVAYDAVDSPSFIAPLLIWQQPHILYMLELLYADINTKEFLEEYWEIVYETAEFMCDFPVFDVRNNRYNLCGPIIPAQEEHKPLDTLNPVFELEYWYFGLTIAIEWAKRLNKRYELYISVRHRLSELPVIDDCYPAHANCYETFTQYNKDHPSMLAAYGFLPGFRIDKTIMKNTYEKVMRNWKFETMWGWDFALMSMTMVRLNRPDEAVDILLMDTAKNTYVTSGNNYQKLRSDLPVYLPGNGSLLLAVALMTAGYVSEKYPGFPDDGSFEVVAEDFIPYPF